MPELVLIEPNDISTKLFDESNEVTLHQDILEILFRHKEHLYRSFDDVKGTFFIDHMAVKIIDPSNTMTLLSTTPSVEYNLLTQGLWKYDDSFSISYQRTHRFYSWGDAYQSEHFEQLKYLKEKKHGFTFGVNLSKKVGSFHLIYSFATRHQKSSLYEYYRQYISELFSIGDYCYKSVNPIFEQLTGMTIIANNLSDKTGELKPRPFLKLISSNNESKDK
jgi:hypothetical protein